MAENKPPSPTPSPYPPQFIPISGLHNFRDIGGLPVSGDDSSSSTSIVRKGIFYRGPDTATITPEGVEQLKKLGVVMDFDLRSKGQIEKAGGAMEMKGINRVWTPAFPDGEYSPEKAARRYVLYSSEGTEGIVEAFTEILTHAPPAFKTILTQISTLSPTATQSSACFIHCTTGNNRSGVFIAIILSFLGVSNSDIADEYALSEIGLRESREAAVDRLMKSPVFVGGPRSRVERMVGARRESMLALLEMVEKRCGGKGGGRSGAENYLRGECGVEEGILKKAREVLVGTVDGGEVTAKGHKKRLSIWESSKTALGPIFRALTEL